MKHFTFFLVYACLFCAAAWAQQSTPPQLKFSAVQDFSFTSNPNGVWSYGYKAALNGTFQLLPVGGGDCDAFFCGWGFGPNPTDPPSVLSNGYLKLIGTIELQPGGNGEYSVVRFTAPKSGRFNITGAFVGDRDCTSTDVHVLRGGVPIFNDTIVCIFDPSVFHFYLQLKSGDAVDFAVGNSGSVNDDATGLDVTITTLANSASLR